MKFGTRSVTAVAAIIAIAAAGLSFWAGEQISLAGQEGSNARVATFKSYRAAHALKSLAASYELTMNEYYSTVLEFPAYQKKASAQKSAIDGEVAILATLQEGGAATAAEFTRLYKEIDSFRQNLERAMTSAEKDWDGAREALFKINVLSTQAIYQADLLSQSASERATALDMSWQSYQSQALRFLRIAAALALLAGILGLVSILRGARTAE